MSLRFNSCGDSECRCKCHTVTPALGAYNASSLIGGSANTRPLSKLAQSNSKSEDTPDPSKVDELTDKLRKLLNKDGVWSSEYNSVLWNILEIEESATPEPPQDATIQDVVNGTPKGQEAVQKAIDDSIKVQNEMSKEAQDTSLDDKHGKYLDDILWLLNPEQVDLTVEEAKHKILNLFSLERAKLFEQIRREVIGDFDAHKAIKPHTMRISNNGQIDHEWTDQDEDWKTIMTRDTLRAKQLEALTRLETKDE